MREMIIELHYLPSVDYFISLLRSDKVHLDVHSSYSKQSYRNRSIINGPNKVETLTVPVKHTGGIKISYNQVQIDYSQKWLNVHLRSIRSAYGKSPYFEFYFEYVEDVYLKKHEFLFSLNYELLTVCLKLLQAPTQILIHDQAIVGTQGDYLEMRNKINPKKDVYNRDIISHLTYKQLFGNIFVPNLSIIDLLFIEGNNSIQILKNAIYKTQSVNLNN